MIPHAEKTQPAAPITPTIGESILRGWNSMPRLARALFPPMLALLIVLIPASIAIQSWFRDITTQNLQARDRALLTEIGSAIDELLTTQGLRLASLANREAIRACAPNHCADQSALFSQTLSELLQDDSVYTIELSFLNADGAQTVRAVRGNGRSVQTPGDLPTFSVPAEDLARMAAMRSLLSGQTYIFPVGRDERLSSSETYQQPALRLAVPVAGGGYLSTVIGLDDFFAQQFTAAADYQIFMLDGAKCLVAASDGTRRPDLYKTWSAAPDRPCLTDLPVQEWEVSVQRHADTVFSTRVLSLPPGDQRWTLVVQQPVNSAYAQANALSALLTLVYGVTIVLVGVLIVGFDRAMRQFARGGQMRAEAQARSMRYNPYITAGPVLDRGLYVGRTGALAQAVGLGVLGGDGVIIEGDPFSGKTSLLRQLERRMRDQQIGDPSYWYWPVYFDTAGVAAEEFYATLMETLLREVENYAERTDLRYEALSERRDYSVDAFHEDLNEVIELPNSAGRPTRLVLLVDNMQVWHDPTLGYDPAFRRDFRELFTGFGPPMKLIAAVLPTGQRLFEDKMLAVVRLGPLDADDTERLIRQPVAAYYKFADDAAAYLTQHSDRLPMHAQRLAHHAVAAMLEQQDYDGVIITREHAEQAVRRLMAELEPYFRQFWEGRVLDTQTRQNVEQAVRQERAPGPPNRVEAGLPLTAYVVYTDTSGARRLTTLFKVWLRTAAW